MLRIVVVAWLVLLPSVAFAEEPADTRDAMQDYFAGERTGGYVLIGMGVGGLVAGGLLYRSSSLTAKGASYPLLGIGLLHVAAGIYINIASAGRVDTFNAEIDADRAGFVSRERTRMAGVSTQFTILKIAEILIATGGLTMAGIGWRTDRPHLKGAGLALAAEMALTFGFDVVAARRAHHYRDRLATIDMMGRVGPDTNVPTYMFVMTRAF